MDIQSDIFYRLFLTCLLGFGSALIDVSFNVIHDAKVGRSDVVQRLTMMSVYINLDGLAKSQKQKT